MQDDEVSNEEFDSFEEEQRQRRCKIIAVGAVVAVIVIGAVICIWSKKNSGGGKAASASGFGPYLANLGGSDDEAGNCTNATCASGCGEGDLYKDMDTVYEMKIVKSFENTKSNWGDNFSKGSVLMKTAQMFVAKASANDMTFSSARVNTSARGEILSLVKLMIQACPDWSELPDWVSSHVFTTGANRMQSSVYWDPTIKFGTRPAADIMKVDSQSSAQTVTHDSAGANLGAWVVGNRASLGLNMALLNQFCQQDDLVYLNSLGLTSGPGTSKFVTWNSSQPVWMTAPDTSRTLTAEANQRFTNAVSGDGTVPCMCASDNVGYLDIEDRIDALSGQLENLITTSETQDDYKMNILNGVTDEAIVSTGRTIKYLENKIAHLKWIGASCPRYLAAMGRSSRAINTIRALGYFNFNVSKTQHSGKAPLQNLSEAKQQTNSNVREFIGSQFVHQGIFSANAGAIPWAYSQMYGWNDRSRGALLANMEDNFINQVKSNQEAKDAQARAQANYINGFHGSTWLAIVSGEKGSAGAGFAFDALPRLALWKNDLTWEDMDGMFGAVNMADAMNAICQLKMYEENMKVLNEKFTQITTKDFGAALQGDRSLTPYLLATGAPTIVNNGAKKASDFGGVLNERAYMMERMFSLDIENLLQGKEMISKMWEYMNSGDYEASVDDAATLYMEDNMRNMLDAHFALRIPNFQVNSSIKKFFDNQKEMKGATNAAMNLNLKWFRKIRSVLYIVDKFVRHEQSKKIKSDYIKKMKSESLEELKNETWQTILAGKPALGFTGYAYAPFKLQYVQEPSAQDKSERIFGRLDTIAKEVGNNRMQTMIGSHQMAHTQVSYVIGGIK